MKFKYIAAIAAASIISLGMASTSINVNANPCAGVNPCAANPCAGVNPCAANPCAGVNPCAANPCAGVNPCAANPCAGVNPCAANPCAGVNPCAANPCAGVNPCAAAVDSAPAVYTESSSGLAIRGTDPVAYFTEGKAVAGDSKYETEWQDATWRFASAENQKLFESNPEAYAPQYGGYCAKALSEGNVVSTDPQAWSIVDGKLYLNYSLGVQKQWEQDIQGNIELADNMWP
ncbi:MAG: YHS domain-containing (seleno)protein, partial [Cyanobacteria bacterium P01_C01_bin.72]